MRTSYFKGMVSVWSVFINIPDWARKDLLILAMTYDKATLLEVASVTKLLRVRVPQSKATINQKRASKVSMASGGVAQLVASRTMVRVSSSFCQSSQVT